MGDSVEWDVLVLAVRDSGVSCLESFPGEMGVDFRKLRLIVSENELNRDELPVSRLTTGASASASGAPWSL